MTRDNFVVKDSGARQEFAGGGVRDTEDGKLDYTLTMDGPMFDRWAAHLTKGAKKYSERNWMKFQDDVAYNRARRSAVRHLRQWLRGDIDEDHAAAVFFNINVAEYIRDNREIHSPLTIGVDSTMPLRIYVAGPFSAPTKQGRALNRDRAVEVWLELMKKGHYAHCPHQATDPGDTIVPYEQFMGLDLSLIESWANALYFIGSSPGADRELALAKSLGLPIYYSLDEVPDYSGKKNDQKNLTSAGSLAVGGSPTCVSKPTHIQGQLPFPFDESKCGNDPYFGG